ncbi:MAG: hypothetical protein HQK64_14225 [Desulfamplus sp.]|nr:hypothetical protein [Desulfamplus sp.]
MEITITLPNNFKSLPETEKLRIISMEIEDSQRQQGVTKTKWGRIAQEIRQKKLLSGASDFILNQSKEFREGFSFNHDHE